MTFYQVSSVLIASHALMLCIGFVVGAIDSGTSGAEQERDRLRERNRELEHNLWRAQAEACEWRRLHDKKVQQNASIRQYLVREMRNN